MIFKSVLRVKLIRSSFLWTRCSKGPIRSIHASNQRMHGGSSQPIGMIEEGDEKFITRSPYKDVVIPNENIAEYVWKHVSSYPDNVALVCGMTGRSYTYEMAYQMSQRFGSALKRSGAKKGDVVAMILPNLPEFPIGTKIPNCNETYRSFPHSIYGLYRSRLNGYDYEPYL